MIKTDRKNVEFIKDKKYRKQLWGPVGKAMHEYRMINENDVIAVGLSGGKDSITLLNSLIRIKHVSNLKFQIVPIHIQNHMRESACDEIKSYCNQLGLELYIEKTNINEIIFGNNDKTSVRNPCFLCGRMRRGILYRIMKERKINKLALGHHKDDIIETYLMNVFYQGNMNIMKPMYISQEYQIKIIRPLSYVEEKDIKNYINEYNLPILKSECPYETNKNSARKKIKDLISQLSLEKKDIRSTIFNSIKNFKEI
ncbi:tRNA 2-thiocytidine biosynthesis TtcA family protein [Fusobacterium sp. PH5-44]|uniref:tRNA 2-thiocytidine biosynthesis TtcA family protein n=1 Tax=unclassified Fusobacterium TaxID=2648384 RepID=UPI003D23E736